MKKLSKENDVSIVRVHRRRFSENKKKSSTKKSRRNMVVHVHIRTSETTSPKNTTTNSDICQRQQFKSEKTCKVFHCGTKINPSGTPTTEISEVFPSKSDVMPIYKMKDEKGTANNFHRKGKKPKAKRIISTMVAIVVVFLVLITIILLIVLIKLKSNPKLSNKTPQLRWNLTGITVAGLPNSPGNGSHQLNDPADIVLDYENNLYIADRKNHRIQRYLYGSRNGTTVPNSYQLLQNPARVILDSNRNLYISDTSNQRIQFCRHDATNATTVAGITNLSGNSSYQLNTPIGIALRPTSGELYISDQFNHRIVSYASGTNSSTLVFGNRGPGINNTQLYFPYGLHFDPISNSLIIANLNANNVVRYTFGANTWTLVAGNLGGLAGNTSTSLNSPYEATLDPMDNVYVADRNNHRIQFYSPGQFDGTTIAGVTGVNGINNMTLASPRSLRLDTQLNLYVADTSNHRVQKFLRY